MPLSVDTPAPPKKTARRALRSSSASCSAGCLDGEEVVIRAGDEALNFPRKTVSLVRLVPDLSALDDDTEGIVIDSDTLPDE